MAPEVPYEVRLVAVAEDLGQLGPVRGGRVPLRALRGLDDAPAPDHPRGTGPDVLVEQPLQAPYAHPRGCGELTDPSHRTVRLRDRCHAGDLTRAGQAFGVLSSGHLDQRLAEQVHLRLDAVGRDDSGEQGVPVDAEGVVEGQSPVGRRASRSAEEGAETAGRGLGRDGPAVAHEVPPGEPGDQPVRPRGRAVARRAGVVGRPDADVPARVVEHLLVVADAVGQVPGDGPEPVDDPGQLLAGGVATQGRVPPHHCGVDDAARVVGE